MSASIQSANGHIEQLVDCGDVVNVTTAPIPTVAVLVGACLQRRCCLYTGADKSGVEYCINQDGAPVEELPHVQAGGKFVVVECLAEWALSLTVTGGSKPSLEVACGETFDVPEASSLTITSITTHPCIPDFAVADSFDDQSFDQFADQAVVDTQTDNLVDDAAVDQFDQAVGDATFEQAFEEQYVDQAVSVDQLEQAFVDEFADQVVEGTDQYADQAVVDYAVDQAVDQYADQAVVDYAVDQNTDVFAGDVFIVDSAVYEASADFIADDNYDAAFSDATFADATFVDGFEANLAADQYADQAVVDFAVDQAVDQYADQYADQAVVDYAVDQAADQYADQAVVDYAVDQAVDQYADQAVVDYAVDQYADQAVAADNFVDESFSDFQEDQFENN